MSMRSAVLRSCRMAGLSCAVVWGLGGAASAQTAPPSAPAGSTSDQRIQARLLDKQLRSVRMQELLIESGNLDKEAGHVSQPVLVAAARDFRAAIGSAETGPLTDDEQRKLQQSSAAFLAFADYTRVQDADTGITVTLPRNLFSPVARPKSSPDPNWTTYISNYGGMQIHVFRYRLLAETPVSLVSRLIERRQNINFERFEISGSEFAIDITADHPAGKPYFMAVRGWETGGFIIGFQAVFDIDHSPALQVPDLPVPAAHKTTYYPNGRASGRTVQVTEREGNWRRVIKALVNRLGTDFEVSNGWRVLSSEECRKRPTTGRGGQEAAKVVRVVFATDRQRVERPAGAKPEIDQLFGAAPDDQLHIGCAILTVPPDPTISAKIQRPRPTARGHVEAFDPKRHFGLDSVVSFGSSGRLGRGEELALVDEGREGAFERALLMIHGYNTSFADAMLRVAQVAATVDQNLRVYLFSWPSRERYLSYVDDLDNAERAEQSLQYFMKLILRDANVRQLDVIAHSMGSQSLLRSIDGLRTVFDQRAWDLGSAASGEASRPSQVRLRLGQVIFAAPDVSRPIFERQLMMLAPFARRVTIYTSAVDRALWLSEMLRSSPRAGYLGTTKEPIRSPVYNVHVIDVTGKPLPRLSPKRLTEFNHNYFVENPAVLNDIQSILTDGTVNNPKRRAEISRIPLKHSFVEVPYKDSSSAFYWKLVDRTGR